MLVMACIFSRRITCTSIRGGCLQCHFNPMQFNTWAIMTIDQAYDYAAPIQDKVKECVN